MRSNKEWRKLYSNYIRHYKKRSSEIKKRFGKEVEMASERLDYWGFRNAFAGTEINRLEEQAAGLRGKSLNVMRDLINEQTYGLGYDQGRKYLKGFKKYYKNEISSLKKELKQKTKAGELSQKEIEEYNDNIQDLTKKMKGLSLGSVRMELYDKKILDDMASEYYKQLKMDPKYAGDDNTYAMAQDVLETIYGGS